MASNKPIDYFQILETLVKHDVAFVLVGGLCAIVHGAPLVTFDVDIVHQRTEDNIKRLLKALEELEAIHRYHPAKITPKFSHLEGTGHSLLETKAGNLDVLGSIDEGRDYDELCKFSELSTLGEYHYRLLNLTELIEVKRRAGRDKDIAALPVLQNTLKLSQSNDG